jgi:hypothetical protein
LQNAIVSLEEGIGVVSDAGWFNAQNKAVQNTLVADVVQNFEFVYELAFKTIKRQIEAEAPNPAEVDEYGFRDKHSDLDLAVIGEQPLSMGVSGALAEAFSESDLPWRVDVVDWATTSETFRRIIERDKVVVQGGLLPG